VAEGLLGEVSRERIREEIVLILSETAVADSLAMLDATGIWRELFKSDIRVPGEMTELFRQGDEALGWYLDLTADRVEESVKPWVIRWLLLGSGTDPATFSSLSVEFRMGQHVRRAISEHESRYLGALEVMWGGKELADSRIYRSLHRLAPETMVLLAREGGPAVRRNLTRYLTCLVMRKPLVDGNDLMAMGMKAGPAVGSILEAIFDAQLDGAVTDRSSALALARDLAASSGNGR